MAQSMPEFSLSELWVFVFTVLLLVCLFDEPDKLGYNLPFLGQLNT